MRSEPRRRLSRAAAVVAVVFGLATVHEGGNVLFGDGAASIGHIVPFVLYFNFAAGFVYVMAGLGLWRRKRWSAWVALALALATLAIFAAFGVHVAAGGAFEMRTVWAMSLRSLVWLLIAALAFAATKEEAGTRLRLEPGA